MSGLFTALASFIPNLVAHYSNKSILKSSETWVGLIGIAGAVAQQQGWVQPGVWDQTLAPALVYTVGRITSKGLQGPVVPAAPAAPSKPAAS